ncbi:MAG: AI-2E family transporter [Bacteroidota bacterium]
MPSSQNQPKSFSEFTRRTWAVIGATAAAAIVLLIIWRLTFVLLLLLAGVLIAVLLRGLARPLASRLPGGDGWALLAVIVIVILVLGAVGSLMAPRVSDQIQSLVETLPVAFESTQAYLEGREWGAWIIERVPEPEQLGAVNTEGLLTNFFGVFATTLGALANVLFILALGVYLALNPSVYWKGIVLLVPPKQRPRAEEVVLSMGSHLWTWLKGQFVMMVVVGTLTGIGLSIAGVPLALALGVIAGLFEFVPIVGPFAAAVPGIIVALAHSPTTALYAIIVYIVVQQLEGNLLTPLVMRQMVSLPPALTLSATIIAGVMFGLPGVLLATPLALLVVILVREVYINDLLGDSLPPVPHYGGPKKS